MPETEGNSLWNINTTGKLIVGVTAVLFSAAVGLIITLLLRSGDERQRQIDLVPQQLMNQLASMTTIMETQISSLRNEIEMSKGNVAESIARDMGALNDGISRVQRQINELAANVRRIEEHITAIRMWAERGGTGKGGTPSPDPPPTPPR